MMARAGSSCWTPPSPKWEVWWCWESNADSQPSSGLQPQPPRFQFILSSPITSCYFHLPFLTTCPVDFMLQHQTQKGQPHIDCATISHNCLRSNQIYVLYPSGSASLLKCWLMQVDIEKQICQAIGFVHVFHFHRLKDGSLVYETLETFPPRDLYIMNQFHLFAP